MRRLKTKAPAALLFGLGLLMAGICFPTGQSYAEVKKIIRDTAVNADYVPGRGTPIGKIRTVSGKVYIMHDDMNAIYLAQNDFSLYAGDTLTAKENGRIILVLKDDSVLTLAPGTTMVLNEAVFDPATKRRSALVNLVNGKARFFVKKFSDFQYSKFNVRTKTSIAAVRGSDFIIEQIGDRTIITTLGMTILEVINPDYPLEEPIVVNSFQQLVATLGQLPGNPFNITEEELAIILNDLDIPTDDEDSGGEDEDGDDEDGDDDDGDGDDGDGDGSPIPDQPDFSGDDRPISPYSP